MWSGSWIGLPGNEPRRTDYLIWKGTTLVLKHHGTMRLRMDDDLEEMPNWQGALYVTWLIVLVGLYILAVP